MNSFSVQCGNERILIKMENFEIRNYLQNYDKQTHRGVCKACFKNVEWSKRTVASHKRVSCIATNEQEKRIFAKRSAGSQIFEPNLSTNFTRNILPEEKSKNIRSAIANFFYRSGISLRLVDSSAFKEMIESVDPAAVASVPCSKTSGSLQNMKNVFKK